MSNLPDDLTGKEHEWDEGEDDPPICDVKACNNILCERALDLGASNCCDRDDRAECPICFPEENDDDA